MLGRRADDVQILTPAGGSVPRKARKASDGGGRRSLESENDDSAGYFRMMKLLSKRKLDMFAVREVIQLPNAFRGTDNMGFTLLHHAAMADDTITAGLALARGVLPTQRDAADLSPLHLALRKHSSGVVKMLMKFRDVREDLENKNSFSDIQRSMAISLCLEEKNAVKKN